MYVCTCVRMRNNGETLIRLLDIISFTHYSLLRFNIIPQKNINIHFAHVHNIYQKVKTNEVFIKSHYLWPIMWILGVFCFNLYDSVASFIIYLM